MGDFALNVLSDFLGGLLVMGFMAAATFIYRTLRRRRHLWSERELDRYTGASVATTINQFIERQAQVIRRRSRPRTLVIERRITVEPDATEEDPWLFLIGMPAVMAIVDYIWVTYQLEMLYAILAGSGIGLGTSFYLVVQLRRMRPPWQLEDYVLSWGGLVVWLTSAATAWLSVFYPLYNEPASSWTELDLMGIHLVQLIGMLFLFFSIAAMTAIQLVTGRLYQKALQRIPPKRLESKIWEWRMYVFAGVFISIIVAFLLATGVVF